MEKIWLNDYPEGVPAEIDLTRYASLTELFEESFDKYASKPAFTCMGKTLTYAQLDTLSARLAAWFQSKGLEKGTRVALMMPNILQYPVALIAVLRAGYVVVNINPLYTPRELEHQLQDSGAEAIVLLENLVPALQPVIGNTPLRHVIVASPGDLLGLKGWFVNFVMRKIRKQTPDWNLPAHVTFRAAMAQGACHTFRRIEQHPDDIALLQYTGGTTGVAKGATLLHRNLIANVLQMNAWLAPALAKRPDITQLTTAVALPMYHVFSLMTCGLLTIRMGGLGVLIPNPRDLGSMIKALQGYQITALPAVNTLYNALMNHPDFGKLDFSALMIAIAGGMAVQEAIAKRWYEKTHVPVIEGYGLSETSACVACNPITHPEYTGTIGLPFPSTEISIRDDAGNEVPFGQRGELCIRGPQVMAGYWNHPEETAQVMTADGFLKSGDIAVMNEHGYAKIVDRKKDMILVSGFNVYPNEVEDVVVRHPGVLEVAAVGVPDRHSGEAVKIFVVKKDPALTKRELLLFCRQQLTGYKRPRFVEFRDELPKSNVGKILRRELARQTA